jgi:hypothetical protein
MCLSPSLILPIYVTCPSKVRSIKNTTKAQETGILTFDVRSLDLDLLARNQGKEATRAHR